MTVDSIQTNGTASETTYRGRFNPLRALNASEQQMLESEAFDYSTKGWSSDVDLDYFDQHPASISATIDSQTGLLTSVTYEVPGSYLVVSTPTSLPPRQSGIDETVYVAAQYSQFNEVSVSPPESGGD